MFKIKKLVYVFCAGIVVGLWFGVNLGKGQPIYGNPFHNVSLKDRLVESSGDALEKSGRALKDSLGK